MRTLFLNDLTALFTGRAAIFDSFVMHRVNGDDMLPYFMYSVMGRNWQGIRITGSGINPDPSLAKAAALGEALERYSLTNQPSNLCNDNQLNRLAGRLAGRLAACSVTQFWGNRQELITQLTGEAARHTVLEAEKWPTFTSEQLSDPSFPFFKFRDNESRSWVKGVSLVTRPAEDKPVWVPASLVWLVPTNDKITAGISTGTACHTDETLVKLSGLYEVVERDAFTILWESRSRTPLLDPFSKGQAKEVEELALALKRHKLRFLLRNMTTDLGIPSVLAVIHNPAPGKHRPALAIGAASAGSFRVACLKAAREAYHTWVWMSEEHQRRNLSFEEAWSQIFKFSHQRAEPFPTHQRTRPAEEPHPTKRPVEDMMVLHPYIYGFPEMSKYADFLFDTAPYADSSECNSPLPDEVSYQALPTDPSAELHNIVNSLKRRGYEPLTVDLAGEELSRYGIQVKKVLIPGLVPLSIGVQCRHLANPRIHSVPTEVNWNPQGILPYNQGLPHPFP
ncbi:MAG: YcaO-like family protein [Chloroflexota bacterium]|nr:YcaO-like family protein [Chloroflexota bacterium]